MEHTKVREQVVRTITQALGTVLQPIVVDALADQLMIVVENVAIDEYQRGSDDGWFNATQQVIE